MASIVAPLAVTTGVGLAYGLTNVDMALVLGPTTPPTLAVQILNLFGDPDPIGFYQVPWSALF